MDTAVSALEPGGDDQRNLSRDRALEGTVLSPRMLALASGRSGKGLRHSVSYALLCDKPPTLSGLEQLFICP